ncbi:MAG: endolytic transglycosylase MltG, partial [Spirochaetes bacterium]|nr:endolytic transglycosylase MltG [Spirochaetota bacterium]
FLAQKNYTASIGLSGQSSAEGFLYPDTYKVFKGSDTKTVFSTMVQLFFEKLQVIEPNYRSLTADELLEKVTLAAIIEKEVKNREEAAVVAGVFNNRLQQNMKIQSCATIQYILGEPKEHLLESDLLIPHPYNTYLNLGLPPGPICSPGYTALNAAFHPSKHKYLFFVVKDPARGTHHFSETYEEHLLAQQRYKQLKGIY